MFQIIILNLLLTLPILAVAQIAAVDGECPSGHYLRDGYCISSSFTKDQQVIQRVGKNCPSGWRKDNYGYCIRRDNNSSLPNAIVAVGGKCPSGFRLRDGYCID